MQPIIDKMQNTEQAWDEKTASCGSARAGLPSPVSNHRVNVQVGYSGDVPCVLLPAICHIVHEHRIIPDLVDDQIPLLQYQISVDVLGNVRAVEVRTPLRHGG